MTREAEESAPSLDGPPDHEGVVGDVPKKDVKGRVAPWTKGLTVHVLGLTAPEGDC